ncbi:UDP-glucuronosyl/UDP-glucosyltransferase [Penicillium expansum]|nr:UDP-glucuronosyl/UDP-glucosyltransferase [Penicillium expansum]
MSSKHEMRQLEEDILENNNRNEYEIADELPPPTYNSLFSDDLLLPPPTTRDERRESVLIEDIGRFSIDLSAGNRTSTLIEQFLLPAQRPQIIQIQADSSSSDSLVKPTDDVKSLVGTHEIPLDILLMLVGSREEIKSVILVGQELHQHGHRVRVATHSIFQSLVHRAGLEFFSISSDPEHSIAAKDSGLMPDSSGLDRPQVLKNKKVLLNTLKECWNACTHPGSHENKPFVPDAIIATPLAHAHVHCAERLSIPLHIMSNSPWTPTRRFTHPLAQIETGSEIDYQLQNYISYLLVGESVWHDGAGILRESKIPHTYLWSSELLPKPEDWDDTIDISGYPTIGSPSPFTPSKALENFLDSAIDPVFVALDITQLNNPKLFAQYLIEASQKYGVYLVLPSGFREILNKSEMPKKIFLLENDPNGKEWLMGKISILLTSGDIPTVKEGVQNGKPMISLPLLCEPENPGENGTTNAVQSFYRHLKWEKVRCSDTNTEPVIYRMQLKPSFGGKVETDGVGISTRGGGSPVEPDEYPIHTRRDQMPELTEEKVKTTFLVDAKGVSKSLIKAIIKPTVSHIADAHRKRENQNDVPVPTGSKAEQHKTRTETAMKVARNVGFGSAVTCGKIAMLPFKTVWYMSETASYGVRALQGLDRNDDKRNNQDMEQASNVNNPRVFDEGKVVELIKREGFQF